MEGASIRPYDRGTDREHATARAARYPRDIAIRDRAGHRVGPDRRTAGYLRGAARRGPDLWDIERPEPSGEVIPRRQHGPQTTR